MREIDAVAIDNRDRTRSNGYVEPKRHDKIVNANCDIMMKYADGQKKKKSARRRTDRSDTS